MGFPLECWNTPLQASLLQLLNSLIHLHTGRVPSQWKQTLVVPIPKSANNEDLPNNYRDPVSCWKDVHKVVVEHLSTPHPCPILCGSSLKANHLLQLYWVLTTTHDWFQWTEEWKEICAGFFDLFDSVPYRPLVTKLQQMGVPDHRLVRISGYLTCRYANHWWLHVQYNPASCIVTVHHDVTYSRTIWT